MPQTNKTMDKSLVKRHFRLVTQGFGCEPVHSCSKKFLRKFVKTRTFQNFHKRVFFIIFFSIIPLCLLTTKILMLSNFFQLFSSSNTIIFVDYPDSYDVLIYMHCAKYTV